MLITEKFYIGLSLIVVGLVIKVRYENLGGILLSSGVLVLASIIFS